MPLLIMNNSLQGILLASIGFYGLFQVLVLAINFSHS
ncbi:hypothetical protein NC651_010507 [Populus alba x Populus x berolinensis]|nr:hypothetical protein NC651_010507 [Populus alba x Populus x berolinensis]